MQTYTAHRKSSYSLKGFQSRKNQDLENYTLFRGTYPYRPNKGVPPGLLQRTAEAGRTPFHSVNRRLQEIAFRLMFKAKKNQLPSQIQELFTLKTNCDRRFSLAETQISHLPRFNRLIWKAFIRYFDRFLWSKLALNNDFSDLKTISHITNALTGQNKVTGRIDLFTDTAAILN